MVGTAGDRLFLGSDVVSGVPVELGPIERRQGLYIIGTTGMGKSTLLESLIAQDMDAGFGLCLLDPHGDLVDAVLARVPEARERDVILIDLADGDWPFGLNPFECPDLQDRNLVGRIVSQAVEVFEKIWGELSWGPQLAQILRNSAYTLVQNPGFTMAEMRRLLLDERFRARLVGNVTHPQVREFWELEFGPMRLHDQQQLVRSTLNKVDEFLTPSVYPIMGFGKNTVDFREAMDEGRIVLFRLSQGRVGAATVNLIGSMLVGQLYNAALSRDDVPPSQRRQFNLYADEYERFAIPTFADLLEQARKYAIATTMAHQTRSQLDARARGATLNASNMLVFRVHGEDGEELAKQFDRTPPEASTGTLKRKLAVTQDPITYLISSTHEDEEVRWITSHRLGPWVQVSRSEDLEEKRNVEVPSINFVFRVHDRSLFSARDARVNPKAVGDGLRIMNSYLVDMMEGRIVQGSHDEALRLNQIAVALRGLMDCADGPDVWEAVGLNRDKEPWEKNNFSGMAFIRHLAAMVQDPQPSYASQHRADLVAQRRRVRQDDATPGVGDADVDNLDFHVRWIRKLGKALADAPIVVDSGQWYTEYDKPRTYADVEAEIASNLVGLGMYRARYRIRDGMRTLEGTVKTPEFQRREATADAVARADRIRQHSRTTYCAPVETVVEAIRSRQRDDGRGPGPQRRVPLSE